MYSHPALSRFQTQPLPDAEFERLLALLFGEPTPAMGGDE